MPKNSNALADDSTSPNAYKLLNDQLPVHLNPVTLVLYALQIKLWKSILFIVFVPEANKWWKHIRSERFFLTVLVNK